MTKDPEVIAKVETNKPDLSRLAATEIMGFVLKTFKEAGFESACPEKAWFKPDGECEDGSIAWKFVCWKDQLGEVWTPLTDLNQCFVIVNKMDEKGWWLFWNNEENEATFYRKTKHLNGLEINSDLGTAIITAALKAKGVEVE